MDIHHNTSFKSILEDDSIFSTFRIRIHFYSGKGARLYVATPLWPSVGVKPNTPKVGDLESSGTPECLGFDSRGQNTSP
jgi:hypothetical protein